MITQKRKNRWLLCATAIPTLLFALTTNVQATALYDVSTMVSMEIQSITNLTNNGMALPQIDAHAGIIFDTSSSTGTGFTSTNSSVNPDVSIQNAVSIGVGEGTMTQSMASGGASLPGGTATATIDTGGTITFRNTTSDSFAVDFLINWSYSVETSSMNPGEFAAATFDAQVNTGGALGADNVFFEGEDIDFYNTASNPGLFSDSDSFVFSYTVVPNEIFHLISFSFADGNASAMTIDPGPGPNPGPNPGRGPAPVPEPSTMLLLGSGLAGLALWRSKRGRSCND